jgi:hypothetical protein
VDAVGSGKGNGQMSCHRFFNDDGLAGADVLAGLHEAPVLGMTDFMTQKGLQH